MFKAKGVTKHGN